MSHHGIDIEICFYFVFSLRLHTWGVVEIFDIISGTKKNVGNSIVYACRPLIKIIEKLILWFDCVTGQLLRLRPFQATA